MPRSDEGTAPEAEFGRTVAYALTVLIAFMVVTCSAATRSAPDPSAASGPRSAASSAQSPAPSAAARGAGVASGESAAPPVTGAIPELARFRQALDGLAGGGSQGVVRVAWLGDSHAAADFWPNAVRRALQERFGNGGAGFLYVGLKVYRHSGVLVERSGAWRVEPRAPSLWTPQGDGTYGLGGIRTIPTSVASEVELTLRSGALSGAPRWEVRYRLPQSNSRFKIDWASGSRQISAEAGSVGAAQTVRLDGVEGPLVIGEASGDPEIFGVTVESEGAGVVVDTLGINGARIGTPTAWNRAAWIAELQARAPALAVLAYGTNEAGDAVDPSKYAGQFEEVVGRLREAQPRIDCWILGPTDRADPNWQTLTRVLEIDAVQRQTARKLGCAFTSTLELMGGEGSIRRWAEESPPLAGSDRVHLTPKGYRELGDRTARELFTLLGIEAAP